MTDFFNSQEILLVEEFEIPCASTNIITAINKVFIEHAYENDKIFIILYIIFLIMLPECDIIISNIILRVA